MNRITTLIITLPLVLLSAEWQSLDGPPAGRADDMSIGWHEGSQVWHIYAVDQTHKLYKSVNEGEFWDSLTYLDITKNPTCVITRPNDAQILYIGKDDDVPVWWSENGGQTWAARDSGITNEQPLCFAMDPNNSNKIYLGCASDPGPSSPPEIFKTTNAGDDWESLDNSPEADINDIAITHNGTWIIAGCSETGDRGIWLSTDGGDYWYQKLSGVNIYCVKFASQDTGYAGSDNGIYISSDGGENWSLLENSPDATTTDLEALSPTTTYAATTWGIHKTTDGGNNWIEMNNGIYASKLLSLIIHPANSQTIIAGGFFSVYKTTNGGEEWQELSKGFKLNNFKSNHISIHSK